MSFATFRFFYGVIHGMVFLIFFYLVLVFLLGFLKNYFYLNLISQTLS